jgi:hypothetical protein
MAELLRGVPFDYEPKRNNRFVAEFADELGIETWKVQSFKRPSLNINPVEIPFINETQYVAGRYKWSSLEISFLDPIGPSTSIQLMEWVRLHVESLTGRMGYAAGYKKNILLKQLDPTGVEVEKWLLEQCQITDIDFGQNDMGDDELTMISLTIQPWRCILNF